MRVICNSLGQAGSLGRGDRRRGGSDARRGLWQRAAPGGLRAARAERRQRLHDLRGAHGRRSGGQRAGYSGGRLGGRSAAGLLQRRHRRAAALGYARRPAVHHLPPRAVRRGGPDAGRPRDLRCDHGRDRPADARDRPAARRGRAAPGRGPDGRPRRALPRRIGCRTGRGRRALDLAVPGEPAVRDRAHRRDDTGWRLGPASTRGRSRRLDSGPPRRPRGPAGCAPDRV